MSMRGRYIRCTTISGTPQERWEQLYGTTVYGNLPQHKKHNHVGHCWAKCPYDTTCSGVRRRHMVGTETPPEGTVLHEAGGKHYYMKTHSRGVWGFECTFDGCPYYITYGKRYFFV